MMLPLICLTGTPSNRTSRARLDRVAGRRVTLDYNGLLICNPDGNSGCNTRAVLAESARGHHDRLSTQSDWRPRAWLLRPWWSVAGPGKGEA